MGQVLVSVSEENRFWLVGQTESEANRFWLVGKTGFSRDGVQRWKEMGDTMEGEMGGYKEDRSEGGAQTILAEDEVRGKIFSLGCHCWCQP